MTRSLYHYRSFIWHHALSDLRHRYAGTGMGMVWNVLHPLALIAVYATLFGFLFGREMAGIPSRFGYTIFLCAGFFPWIGFSEAITRGSTAFASNAAYLKKLPIPEQVFVAQTAMSATLGLGISFTLLVGVSLALGLPPTWHWLLLPIPLALLQAVGFGLGLIFGVFNVFFNDVAQLLGIGLQVLFWMTPIIYRRHDGKLPLPAAVQRALAFNPVTPAIEAVRDLFVWGKLPEAWTLWALLAWGVASVVAGHLVLRALRPEIRDVL